LARRRRRAQNLDEIVTLARTFLSPSAHCVKEDTTCVIKPVIPLSRVSGADVRAAKLLMNTKPTTTKSASGRSSKRRWLCGRCANRAEETEFITISYWESIEAMSRFTGGDPTRIHHLDRDSEFLIELPSAVQILRILASHGNTGGEGTT
jgi:hypothetical protein